MTASDSQIPSQKSLLGEILTHVAGAKPYSPSAAVSKVVLLERERTNLRDSHTIRLKNAQQNALGYLPRAVASWLAPLLDSRRVRIEGYVPSQPTVSQGLKTPVLPLVLSVFTAEQAEGLLEKKELHSKEDVLHQVVYQAYRQVHEFTDPKLIEGLVESLKPLARQKMHFETHLLLALLPGIANEHHVAQGVKRLVQLKELLSRVSLV